MVSEDSDPPIRSVSRVWSPSERVGCARVSKASTARYHRIVKALGELVSDQRVQAINRLGRLVECSGFDESQDCAEISHILRVYGGQFHVAISTRLPAVSVPRLDALPELLEFTTTDLPGAVRSG